MVTERVELSTFALLVRRANQLSHATCFHGDLRPLVSLSQGACCPLPISPFVYYQKRETFILTSRHLQVNHRDKLSRKTASYQDLHAIPACRCSPPITRRPLAERSTVDVRDGQTARSWLVGSLESWRASRLLECRRHSCR